MIQIGELTKVIQELDAQIAETKPKAATALIAERNAKMEEQEAVKRQLAIVEQRITVQLAAEKRVETITKSASDQQVSYQEEREIASSESYKRYVEKAIPALELEKQIATLEAQLQEARSESRALTAKAVADPTQENKLNVQQHAQQVAQLEKQLVTSKQELLAKQQLANAELPSNGTEAMKWQNLLKRGVEPVQRAAIIAALVPMPANGLEINKTAVATNMSKPIPVDVKSPTGLVYRVQVGAFSKPIPQDRFREFNPVSGETLDNGITRYMAGYFNSANSVTDARNKIRAIGYKDAFAIAYCDGKRISLAEAKALEASGRCVPKGENELIMEMAANTAVNLGITVSDSVLPALPEVDYNMVPGGVKSEPVEKHPGLFFTVQVGVFNNPVNAKVVNVMQPLISNRLPNGQIRYSSGMFASIEEARPKKQEAIDKGIKDAFITAYYKSQRITLAEAEQLLTQKGAAVLEPNRISEVKEDVADQTAKAASTNQTTAQTAPKSEVKIDPALITPLVKVEQKLQIVTKKTFDEFPREVLNRYNSHGSFYYDEQDKRVKSAVANSKESLPQVYYFKDDVDTVIVEQPNVINVKDVRIDFVGSSIPGDFTDWLLRYNYRREFKRSDGNTVLRIYAIPEEKLDVLQGKLGEFGLTGTVE
jgi:chemotaxis protein histidine kinase CheA